MTHAAPAPRRHGRVVWSCGLAVAVAAAVATAHGLFEVALAARVPSAVAWLYPVITDGLALVAYAATARLTRSAARYAWSVVLVAAGLSGLAQAVYLASGATLTAAPALRFGVGAWPAVAAATTAHLLWLLATDLATDGPASRAAEDTTEDTTEDTAEPATAHPAAAPVPAASLPAVAPAGEVPAAPSTRPAVQPDPRPVLDAASACPTPPAPTRSARPTGPGVAPSNPAPAAGARTRARTAAVRHAARHGALPTVSVLAAAAQVSRGTAATVLKPLRGQPLPLHLITTGPDPTVPPNDDAIEEHNQP